LGRAVGALPGEGGPGITCFGMSVFPSDGTLAAGGALGGTVGFSDFFSAGGSPLAGGNVFFSVGGDADGPFGGKGGVGVVGAAFGDGCGSAFGGC